MLQQEKDRHVEVKRHGVIYLGLKWKFTENQSVMSNILNPIMVSVYWV